MDINEWLIDRERAHWQGCEEHHIRCAVSAELTRLQNELNEARRVAVWAARHGATYYADKPVGHVNYWLDEKHRHQDERECDGTDADIYRALEEAAGCK